MRYYPVVLDLRDRWVLIVGGGHVAERKVMALLDAGARVRVVSHDLTPALAELHARGRILWRRGDFAETDLNDVWLVIGATDDPETNRRVAHAATRHRLFCNIVDETALCSFLAPAVVAHGDILIAISTSGQSPALAQHLKQKIAATIGPEYGDLARLLGEMRALMRRKIPDPTRRAEAFHRLVASNLLELLRARQWDRATQCARALIEEIAARPRRADDLTDAPAPGDSPGRTSEWEDLPSPHPSHQEERRR